MRPRRTARTCLLVTAHPDDEAMFFAPTIVSLCAQGFRVHLLCLSTGDADGLGSVRRRELVHACSILGVQPHDVRVVDDPALPDGMATSWDAQVVAEHVAAAVEAVEPGLVVTFDSRGVSRHPNHTATYAGVLAFKRMAQAGGSGRAGSATFLMLETVSTLQKFASALDALFAWASKSLRPGSRPCHCCLQPALVWQAMQAHRSQFVWYRRLFILFSRYTFVNTLRELG